uniref:Uncharacterized protein LOC111133409 n=1 Tax=Crassostrea virginica TaxID=6565 RepID=A0A8B8EA40_CRAVI|nr:uncharacterized protein LOC111133409 [Crassostrea virginica]XP_022337523.1 uncharacterized protein LOC111133409 [Crassostrea virginica]
MPIQRHTEEFPDAYWDISLYTPEHNYTAEELEMFFISPRPQFPPPGYPHISRPEEPLVLVTSLEDFFEEMLEEAVDEVDIEAKADPIAYKDIQTAFFNATNIEYPKQKKLSRLRRGVRWVTRCLRGRFG